MRSAGTMQRNREWAPRGSPPQPIGPQRSRRVRRFAEGGEEEGNCRVLPLRGKRGPSRMNAQSAPNPAVAPTSKWGSAQDRGPMTPEDAQSEPDATVAPTSKWEFPHARGPAPPETPNRNWALRPCGPPLPRGRFRTSVERERTTCAGACHAPHRSRPRKVGQEWPTYSVPRPSAPVHAHFETPIRCPEDNRMVPA